MNSALEVIENDRGDGDEEHAFVKESGILRDNGICSSLPYCYTFIMHSSF
jgi:hypothetical protein